MNIEEKAKAYDEALEKAKIEINTKGIGETVELCEQLFPELAESEDERIRKFLIQHISEWIGCIEHDLKHSSKDIESEKELAMFKAGLAYLEKQKESLPISETCKENANSFTDGIIEVRSFQRGMEEGRKLEKQKEQNGEDGFLEDELSAFLQNYDKEYDDDAAVSDVARHFYEIGKKQNEQKPHTDEEKEYIRTIKSIISDFIRDKKPENLAYYQRIYDWLDGRHVPFSCGHEKGQPAWSEEDENALEYIHDLISWGYSKKFMDAQTAHDMRKWVNEHLGPDTFQNGNSHWKPSEEQMSYLLSLHQGGEEQKPLRELIEQLKKLM